MLESYEKISLNSDLLGLFLNPYKIRKGILCTFLTKYFTKILYALIKKINLVSHYSIFSFPFLVFFSPLSVWAGFLTWVCGVLLFACSLWCGFPQGSVLPVITAFPMVITDTLSQNKHVGMFIYGGPHSESTAGLPLSAFLQTRRDLLVLSLSLSESLLAFRNVSV